jgi:sulfite reductase (ferredoxin)
MSSSVESVKANSRHLRGSIVEELTLDRPDFTKQTVNILKFHGAYQQSDRDLRKAGQRDDFSCMVRVGVPGGALTAEQYLALDRMADVAGDGGMRITSRQDMQFHRVRKPNLKSLIRELNGNLLTTLAACGDVVRNVVCCPLAPPPIAELARTFAREFKPSTRAYYEIWLNGEKAAAAESEQEPLFGDAYLPRKFKIGITPHGDNCVDVYTNDVGIVPVADGFALLVGGGLGNSPGVKATHPRLADPLGVVEPERLVAAVRAIITIHRDHGNRDNRKLARLKYIVEEWGVERFRAELEARLGARLAPIQPISWTRSADHLGWIPRPDGSFALGLPIPSGRIKGALRDGLRALVERLRPDMHLTPQQNLLVGGIAAGERDEAREIAAAHGIQLAEQLPPVVRDALACVALPTCGLALTDAERALPEMTADIHAAMADAGLADDSISVRVTGCPNGCVRPYTAEIGIVGRSVDLYAILLGASHVGTRLGTVFAENVPRREIGQRLRPVLCRYGEERQTGESFGDYCHRVGVEALAQQPAA